MVVVPEITPVTLPVLLTDAIPGALLPHTPPPVALVNKAAEPAHISETPTIVSTIGSGFTVTALVATAVPQLFDLE
jgi:hypothetical protein